MSRVASEAPGKPAATRYEVIATFKNAALVRCELETGRTHQVRVHLAHLGHPLLGDAVYGRKKGGFGRQALHARIVGPDVGEQLDGRGDGSEYGGGEPREPAGVPVIPSGDYSKRTSERKPASDR